MTSGFGPSIWSPADFSVPGRLGVGEVLQVDSTVLNAFVESQDSIADDGTMPETPQLLPSINGYNDLAKNDDGSIDLWFGPQMPEGATGSNWIQTVEGGDFLVALRLYGAEKEFYDQTWKPDDLVKVK